MSIHPSGGHISRSAADAPTRTYSLHLFGGFELRCSGTAVEVPLTSQRLLAFLALRDKAHARSLVAATLWPDTTDCKAGANLRTALWRLHRPDLDVVDAGATRLALREEVWVDARFVQDAARARRGGGDLPPIDTIAHARGELLPGFWDSWLVFERERLRQECIQLHEDTCAAALGRGDAHGAVLAALAAVECDPLRESSNAWLIRAHVARHDRAAALRHYRHFAALLYEELGFAPSTETRRLIDDIWQRSA